jgi:hypothetical protein
VKQHADYKDSCIKWIGKDIKDLMYRRQYVAMKRVNTEFHGVKGFSARNLWLMRSFFIEYSQNTILQPMGAELENALKFTYEKSESEKLHPSGTKIQSVPPIRVATYSFHESLPENMRSLLPSPDEISQIVRAFDEYSDVGLLGLIDDDMEGKDDD